MTEHKRRASFETMDAEKAIQAARDIIADLGVLAEDDDQLRLDTIEGETPLFDILAQIIRANEEDAILIDGIKARMDELRTRDGRLKRRVEMRRALLLKALTIADVQSIELPTATISRKALPAQAVVIDEASIPPVYFVRADPKLDKRALLADLRSGEIIEGATLSNGGEAVQIRSK
jgi:hypothetical protein